MNNESQCREAFEHGMHKDRWDMIRIGNSYSNTYVAAMWDGFQRCWREHVLQRGEISGDERKLLSEYHAGYQNGYWKAFYEFKPPANEPVSSAEAGLREDLEQLIRVCLTNPKDAIGFIAANYPREYAESAEGINGETLASNQPGKPCTKKTGGAHKAGAAHTEQPVDEPKDKYDTIEWQLMACARNMYTGPESYTPKEVADALMKVVRRHYPERELVGLEECAHALDYNAFACEGKKAERPADKKRRARAFKQAEAVLYAAGVKWRRG